MYRLLAILIVVIVCLGFFCALRIATLKHKKTVVALYRDGIDRRYRLTSLDYTETSVHCRFISLLPVPPLILDRSVIEITSSDALPPAEKICLPGLSTMLNITAQSQRIKVVCDQSISTAFQAWLEARPPVRNS